MPTLLVADESEGGYWDARHARQSEVRLVMIHPNGELIAAGNQGPASVASWDGRRWLTLAPRAGEISSMILHGSDIIIGGLFKSMNHVPLTNVARWNGVNWSALGNGLNGVVNVLASDGTNIFAGGEFTASGETPISSIASWDGVAWRSLGERLPGSIRSLVVTNGLVYAAWRIPLLACGVSVYQDAQWRAVGNFQGSDVKSLAWFEGSLFVSGSFSRVDDQEISGIIRLRDGFWKQPAGEIQVANQQLKVLDGQFYVLANGYYLDQSGNRNSFAVARLDGEQWKTLLETNADDATSLTGCGTELFAVSAYLNPSLQPGGPPERVIWHYDGRRWLHLNNGGRSAGGTSHPSARRLAVGPQGIILGLRAITTAVRSPLIWDGGALLTTTPEPSLTVGNREIATIDGQAYAHAVTSNTNVIALLINQTWRQVTPPMPIVVSALAGEKGKIYAGGRNAESNTDEGAVYEWDGTVWRRMGGRLTGPVVSSDLITSLAIFQNQVYVAGGFTSIGGQDVSFVARWTGDAWQALGNLNGRVTSTAIADRLYVVGRFTEADGVAASGIATWNGERWSSLGGGVTNATLNSVSVSRDGIVAVVGGFQETGGLRRGAMLWRRDRWEPLGRMSSSGGLPDACLWHGHDLYIVGEIQEVDSVDANILTIGSNKLAVWHEPGAILHTPLLSSEGIQLFISGTSSRQVILERSTDLATWTGVATNRFGIPGQTISDRRENPAQYYRLGGSR